MDCKVDKIRIAWAAGDQIGALRIAARFFDRSAATKTFKRGMDAHNNPSFYQQLGKSPDSADGKRTTVVGKEVQVVTLDVPCIA